MDRVNWLDLIALGGCLRHLVPRREDTEKITPTNGWISATHPVDHPFDRLRVTELYFTRIADLSLSLCLSVSLSPASCISRRYFVTASREIKEDPSFQLQRKEDWNDVTVIQIILTLKELRIDLVSTVIASYFSVALIRHGLGKDSEEKVILRSLFFRSRYDLHSLCNYVACKAGRYRRKLEHISSGLDSLWQMLFEMRHYRRERIQNIIRCEMVLVKSRKFFPGNFSWI